MSLHYMYKKIIGHVTTLVQTLIGQEILVIAYGLLVASVPGRIFSN